MAEDIDVGDFKADLDLVKRELKLEKNQEAIEKAKEEARQELLKELEQKQAAKEREAENERLKKQLEEQQKLQEELKQKIDEMSSSKQVINPDDPFNGVRNNPQDVINKMSDEDLRKLEEQAGVDIFGPEFMRRHREF